MVEGVITSVQQLHTGGSVRMDVRVARPARAHRVGFSTPNLPQGSSSSQECLGVLGLFLVAMGPSRKHLRCFYSSLQYYDYLSIDKKQKPISSS